MCEGGGEGGLGWLREILGSLVVSGGCLSLRLVVDAVSLVDATIRVWCGKEGLASFAGDVCGIFQLVLGLSVEMVKACRWTGKWSMDGS